MHRMLGKVSAYHALVVSWSRQRPRKAMNRLASMHGNRVTHLSPVMMTFSSLCNLFFLTFRQRTQEVYLDRLALFRASGGGLEMTHSSLASARREHEGIKA